jgi:hypothetical protein
MAMTPRRPALTQFAAGALALAVAAPALAQPKAPPAFPPFPAQKSLTAIADWTRRYSDVPVDRIVGVGADSLFAVELSPEQAPPPGVRAVIRQEAITPEFAKRLGGRSVSMTADIDCAGHRVFQRGVDLHAGSNLQGPSRRLGAAADWQAIPPGTYMERVMAAVCNPTWRPLYDTSAPKPVPVAPPLAALPPAPAPLPAPQPVPAAPQYARVAPQYAPLEASPRAAPPPAPAGSARVELGLFSSSNEAVAAWRAASAKAPGKRLRIELTVDGRQTLYRALIEGFASRLEAETACASMTSTGIDCVVPH